MGQISFPAAPQLMGGQPSATTQGWHWAKHPTHEPARPQLGWGVGRWLGTAPWAPLVAHQRLPPTWCPGPIGQAPDANKLVTPPRRKAPFGASPKGKVGNMLVLVFRNAKSECDQQINCWNRAGLGNLVPKRLGLGVIGSRTFEILLLKISLCIFLSCSLEGCSPQIKVG